MLNNTFLLLNGTPPKNAAQILLCADFVICADGAYNWAKDICKINAVIGDFDSVDVKSIPENIQVIEYLPEKDYTDSQLALKYLLTLSPGKITILGATGGRTDHQLQNFALLHQAHNKSDICIYDDFFTIKLISGLLKENIKNGKIVSISPIYGSANILYTNGLQYPLKNAKIDVDSISCISNIATENIIEICVGSGYVLVFLQN